MAKKIEYYYVFEGYIKASGGGNNFEPVEKGLDLLPNRVFISKDLRLGESHKPYIYVTNINGVLHHIQPPFKPRGAVREMSSKQNFMLIPTDIVQQAYTAHGKTWKNEISKIIASSKLKGITLKKKKIFKNHLKDPLTNPDNPQDIQYKKWYELLKNDEPLYGFVIGKIRALILQFNREEFNGGYISCRIHDDKNNFIKSFEKIPISKTTMGLGPKSDDNVEQIQSIIFGKPDDLPEGTYTISVDASSVRFEKESWSKGLTENRSYTFKEKVRFNITNPVGEFDIIQCDPISIEESLIQQFPVQYAHLTHAAKKKYAHPKTDKNQPLPKALDAWGNRAAWTYDKAKMSVDLINEGSNFNRSKILAKSVWAALRPKKDEDDLSYIQECVDLVFNVEQIYTDWSKLTASLTARSELSHVKEIVWKEVSGHFAKNKWMNDIVGVAAGNRDTKVAVLQKVAEMGEGELDDLLKYVATEKQTRLQKMAGKLGGKVETSLMLAGTALSAYQAGVNVNQVLGIRDELQKNIKDLDSLLESYEQLNSPSREAMQTLERYRRATIQGELNYTKEMAETAMKVLDLTLGILCLIPVTAAAAQTIVLIKTLAETGAQVVVSISKMLDDLITDGYLGAIVAKEKQVNEMLSASYANLRLTPKGRTVPAKSSANLNRQMRFRAEALYGLAALLTRSGYVKRKKESPKDAETIFLQKIERYKVKDYIQNFILNDGWQIPENPSIPMNMYTYWMYATNSHNQYRPYGNYGETYGNHERPLMGDPNIPFSGMFMMGTLDKRELSNHATADFQKMFPIHTMDAESITEFAKAFKTTFDELDKECFEYTGIYYREPDVTDETAREKNTKDGGWQLINPDNAHRVEKLKAISPLHPIRVVLILKADTLPAPYPVTLQLIKEEWISKTDGPKYKDIMRYIDDELLDSEKAWLKNREKPSGDPDKKDGPKWLGCVFYPFYQFMDAVMVGAKPTMKAGSHLISSKMDQSYLEYDKSEVSEAWQAYFEDVYTRLEKNHSLSEKMLKDMMIKENFTQKAYGFEVKVGSPRTVQRVLTGSVNGEKSELGKFPVTLDTKDEKQKMLLNDTFLESNNTKTEYPRLFMKGSDGNEITDHGMGPCWVRIGKSAPFTLPNRGEFTLDAFNWTEPVEFVLTIWASHLDEKSYEAIGIDWKSLDMKFDMELHNKKGWNDTIGPGFSSSLHYMGKLNKAGFAAEFEKDPKADPPESLNSIFDVFQNKGDETGKKWCREMQFATSAGAQSQITTTAFHIFAAHFKLNYTTPEITGQRGKLVHSIRPFGETDDGFFEYVIRNIKTKSTQGLNEAKLAYPGGLLFDKEYIFRFPAPSNHKDIAHFNYLNDEEYKRWLIDQSRYKHPELAKLFK